MFFRNLTLYRFPDDLIASAETLGDALATQPLRELGAMELSTTGFVSPFGRDSSELFHAFGHYVLFTLGQTEKILPAAVVNEVLATRVAAIALDEDRRIGGKERRSLKEAIITELLPRAFSQPRRTSAYLDLAGGWLVIDTASRPIAEAVVSRLRDALGSFPATPLAPAESPRAMMTDWLIKGAPVAGFAFGEECDLKDPTEAGAAWNGRRVDLDSEVATEHLKSGMQVFRLGLLFDKRLSLVLSDDLVVRKLRFLDVATEQLIDAEDNRQDLDATFALMTLELQRLIDSVELNFRLGRDPALHLDGGDAPKAMRKLVSGVGPVKGISSVTISSRTNGKVDHSVTIDAAAAHRIRKNIDGITKRKTPAGARRRP